MKFLKAKTADDNGKTELFNLDKVLTITTNESGDRAKILLAPHLYWWVWTDSLAVLDLGDNDFPKILKEDF